MARLWSTGFELQSVTNAVEWDSSTGTGVTIDTSAHIRTGNASLKVVTSNAASNYIEHQVSATKVRLMTRFYVYFTAFPSDVLGAMLQHNDDVGAVTSCLSITVAGKLRLHNGNSNAAQLGSDSAALSLNTWYRVELDTNGATATAYLNGTQFATGTLTNSANALQIDLGMPDFVASMVAYFDDVAVNDGSGSFQNTLPGAGQIVHLKPNAAGDNNAFTVQIGGTVGAANNYTRVNETTPNDATSYNGDVTSGNIDDFVLQATPSSIGSSDTINVVQVGVRYRALVAAAEAAFKVRVKKASAGTVSSSAAITPNSTTWRTNANAIPLQYPLTTYQNPDSASWTKALLDTAQAGYTISTTNTNAADISTLWVLVDSTPGTSNLSISVSDSITTSESIQLLETSFISTNDSTAISENIRLTVVDLVAVNDPISTSESINIAEADQITVSDSIATSENIQLFETVSTNVSDSTATSENANVAIADQIAVSDSTVTSESITLSIANAVTISDSITTSESTQLLETSFIGVSDSVTASENVQLQIVSFVTVSDSTATSESIKLASIDNIGVSDSITTSESIIVRSDENIGVLDSTATSENVVVLIPTLLISVSDSATTSESILLLDTDRVGVLDSVITSESVQVSIVTAINVSDSMTTAEVVTATFIGTIVVSDSITTAENVAVSTVGVINILVSDSITISESINLFEVNYVIMVSDSAVTSENVITSAPSLFLIGESLVLIVNNVVPLVLKMPNILLLNLVIS